MPRSTKPPFVLELPLKVDSKQDSELQARFLIPDHDASESEKSAEDVA